MMMIILIDIWNPEYLIIIRRFQNSVFIQTQLLKTTIVPLKYVYVKPVIVQKKKKSWALLQST